ncbi:MAG: twin-arginine translocation signal domain-containing protein, partial [Thermoguttaceae bacterium]|nr:twin-arginine translocation signal domain-containing protein [Thermoguttaceae bacterium]
MKISRRRFLAASLAAGSLAFPAPFISADPNPSEKIRVG